MMQKKFGQFSQLEDENPTGSQTKTEMPPIAGSPMPNAGMRNKTMGSVFPAKDDPSAKQFAGRNASAKRLKGLPNQSPLGPITGGPQRPQAKPQQRPGMQQGQQQQPNQDTGTGDQWMGELWQGLTLDEQPQGGFAMGGAVNPMGSNPSMDMYNQVTRELESGGVSGYAHGGMVEQSREIASKGRNGDSMLMHIQPGELEGLQSLLGPVTTNPETGNPEAFGLMAAIAIAAGLTGAGAGIGAIADGKEGAKKGALLGVMAGVTVATAGAGSAPVAATAAPTAAGGLAGIAPLASTAGLGGSAAAPTLASLTAIPGVSAAPLSAGAGVLAPQFGGGLSAAQVASAGGNAATVKSTMLAAPKLAGPAKASPLTKMSKALQSGLGSMNRGGGERQQPMAPPPPPPAPRPMGPVPSPYDKMRERQSGLRSLPGSNSII